MRKAFVTGAGGFIGSHLVDRLLGEGWTVTATDRLPYNEWAGPCDGAEQLPGIELAGAVPNYWTQLLRGHHTAFHCAAQSRIQPSFVDPYSTFVANANVTAALLEGARRMGCAVVYAGSSTADSDPLDSPYALSKHTGEQLCRAYRRGFMVKASIARFYNVYGPRQVEYGDNSTVIGVWEKALREGKKLPIVGDGLHRRAFTHIDDVIAGLVMLADKDQDTPFHLGYNQNYSIIEAALLFVGGDRDRLKFIPMRRGEADATLPPRDKGLDWEATISLEDYAARIAEGAHV